MATVLQSSTMDLPLDIHHSALQDSATAKRPMPGAESTVFEKLAARSFAGLDTCLENLM